MNSTITKDSGRIFSILSFVTVFVVIGLPLWWKTTETYRVSLPYERIHELAAKDPVLPISLEFVLFPDISLEKNAIDIRKKLESKFKELKIWLIRDEFDVRFRQATEDENAQLSSSSSLNGYLQVLFHKDIKKIGNLIVHILPSNSDILPNKCKFYATNHRFILTKISSDIQEDIDDLGKNILELIIYRNALQKSTANVIAPNLIPPDKATMRTLRSSPNYDITFNLIVPQPLLKNVRWNIENAIDIYFQPLFKKLSTLVQFNVKSQVLYLTTLNVKPNFNSDEKHFYLSLEQLPHVLNPIEAKLGSYVSVNQNINFVVYVPMEEESPLFIYDSHGKPSSTNSFLSPRWGGILVYNSDNSSEVLIDSAKMVEVFMGHLRLLLGLRLFESTEFIHFEPLDESFITDWEFDYLLRKNTMENIATVSNTLSSLSQLLGEIENIVINDEVGNWVSSAVESTMMSIEKLENGDLLNAFVLSTNGKVASEKAFFDPSMLALLYFPDDQKYAVYVPLFLPVGVPIIFSLFYLIQVL